MLITSSIHSPLYPSKLFFLSIASKQDDLSTRVDCARKPSKPFQRFTPFPPTFPHHYSYAWYWNSISTPPISPTQNYKLPYSFVHMTKWLFSQFTMDHTEAAPNTNTTTQKPTQPTHSYVKSTGRTIG